MLTSPHHALVPQGAGQFRPQEPASDDGDVRTGFRHARQFPEVVDLPEDGWKSQADQGKGITSTF
jgi:hypothetical protein